MLVRRGTPHSYRNGHAGPTRDVIVMTPRIAALIADMHRRTRQSPQAFPQRPNLPVEMWTDFDPQNAQFLVSKSLPDPPEICNFPLAPSTERE